MRILSQEKLGIIDLPYESIGISIRNKASIIAYSPMGSFDDGFWEIAIYSDEFKAIKAMKMLREQYMKLCSLTTFLQGGMELFAKSISPQKAEDFTAEYKNMNVFQFPNDEEIDV